MSDLSRFRNALHSQRAELMSSLGLRMDSLSSQGRVSEEDQASITHEEFISLTRNRIEHDKLKQLNAALERLSQGCYGLCLECGESIAPKRLAALPWARYCIHCQEMASHRAADEAEMVPAEGVLAD
jgi:DnaK suppressor protein